MQVRTVRQLVKVTSLEVAMLEEYRAPTVPKAIKGARLRMVVFTLLTPAGQHLSAYQVIDRQQ